MSTPIDLETNAKSDTLARLCNLPRLSSSASRLLGVSNDIDSALEEFESIFGADPSLAVELLRVANSAKVELWATVSNLQFAMRVLGIDGTRNLAFTIAMSNYARGGPSNAQMQPLWRHSVATAVIAEQIGQCVAPELPDLYAAGLLHDIGRLGLLHAEGQRYAETLCMAFSSMDEANALEKVLFGMTHAEAGGYLARTWSFPPILCNTIRAHHNFIEEDEGRPLRINQQACILAAELGYPELLSCPVPEAAQVLAEQFRSYPELEHERLKKLILRRIQAV